MAEPFVVDEPCYCCQSTRVRKEQREGLTTMRWETDGKRPR